MGDFFRHLRSLCRWPACCRPSPTSNEVYSLDDVNVVDGRRNSAAAVAEPDGAAAARRTGSGSNKDSPKDATLIGPVNMPPGKSYPLVDNADGGRAGISDGSVVYDSQGNIIRIRLTEERSLERSHWQYYRSDGSGHSGSCPDSETSKSGSDQASGHEGPTASDSSIPELTPFLKETKKTTMDKEISTILETRGIIGLDVCHQMMRDHGVDWEESPESFLGAGKFGSVYRGTFRRPSRTDPSQKCTIPVAVKLIRTGKVDIEQVLSETLVSEMISHPNVVKTFYCFGPTTVPGERDTEAEEGEDDGGPVAACYTIMECLTGGTLATFIDEVMVAVKMTEKESDELLPQELPFVLTLGWSRQIALALAYLHSGGIAHTDVHLNNVILDAHGTVKLIDMGLAVVTRPVGRRDPIRGTLPAMANFWDKYPGGGTFTPHAIYKRDFRQYQMFMFIFSNLPFKRVEEFLLQRRVRPLETNWGLLNLAAMCFYDDDDNEPLRYTFYDIVKHRLFREDRLMTFIHHKVKSSFL